MSVENGLLDLETRELEPHSPEYCFTSRLQTPYDPDVSAERWASFLDESCTDLDARKIEEFIGYALEM